MSANRSNGSRLPTGVAVFGLATSAAVAALVVRGDYMLASGPSMLSIAAAAVLVVSTILMGTAYFIFRWFGFPLAVSQAAAWMVMGRMAIDLTGGSDSPFYPLVYVFASVAGAYVGTAYVLVGIGVFTLIEGLQFYHMDMISGAEWSLVVHATGLLAAAGIVGMFFKSERKKSAKLEEELNVYRRGQTAFDQDADEFKSIREEGRRDQLRESVVRLQDALHHTLSDLHEILKPHTCILFTVDSRTGNIHFRDALSDTEFLNRSAEIREGEGLLGWVWREREALRLTNFQHPPENLVYYRRDEKIKSLLAVPIMRNGTGKIEGILVVDSLQEGYFTTEDERLVWLAANQVVKELETAEQRRREVNEAKISHALYKVSEALNSSLKLDEVLDATMECIEKIVGADLVALALFNQESGISEVVRAHGDNGESMTGKTFAPDESLVGWVTTPEQYLFYSDFATRKIQKPVFGKDFPSFKNIGTFFCYPLVSGSEFLGSLTIVFEEKGSINDYERNALTTTARMVATSIANANLHNRVAQMATTDGLTGLFNHRYFQERLSERIDEARRHPTRHSLVLVDIDHFKKVNDSYGHPIGDKVLKVMSRLLKENVRTIDLAARYGGEEFVLVLANTRLEGAKKLADRIRKQASKLKFDADGKTFKVTISMGVATFPDDARNKQALIEHSDQALYHAKENGRNRVVCYADMKEADSPSPPQAKQH